MKTRSKEGEIIPGLIENKSQNKIIKLNLKKNREINQDPPIIQNDRMISQKNSKPAQKNNLKASEILKQPMKNQRSSQKIRDQSREQYSENEFGSKSNEEVHAKDKGKRSMHQKRDQSFQHDDESEFEKYSYDQEQYPKKKILVQNKQQQIDFENGELDDSILQELSIINDAQNEKEQEEESFQNNNEISIDNDIQEKKQYIKNYFQAQRAKEKDKPQEKAFKCKYCEQPKEFTSKSQLMEHQSNEHQIQLQRERGGFICEFCFKYFVKQITRNRHELYYCPMRQQERPAKSSYQNQIDKLFNSIKSIQNQKR